MRYTLYILFLSTLCLYGQYGQQGVLLATSEGAIRALELHQLDQIADIQEELLDYHALIGITTAEIVRIEQVKLDSRTRLRGWMDNMYGVARITATGAYLAELQIILVQMATEVPQIIPYITETMSYIILEATRVTADFAIALSGETYLDNKGRMDILLSTQEGLDELVSRSNELLGLVRTLLAVLGAEDTIDLNLTLDSRQTLQDLDRELDNLILE